MVWPISTNAITVTWMRGRVDLTSWNVLLFLSPLFLSIYLPSTFIRCPSVPGSPSNPTAVPHPFCFPPHYSLFFLICISLSSPSFIVFLFFLCPVSVPVCLWSLCWAGQPVTLLLWAWRVEMTPELWGETLTSLFSFHSQLQSYLSAQPHFFPLWTSVPAGVGDTEDIKGAGVNWATCVMQKKESDERGIE